MTENSANAKEAAALLAAANRSRSLAQEALRPGVVDVTVLAVAQLLAFLPTARRADFTSGDILVAALCGFGLVSLGYGWLRRRYNLGGRLGTWTLVGAGAVIIEALLSGLLLHGDAAKLVSGVAFGVVLLTLGVYYRSALMVIIGGVSVLFGVSDGLRLSEGISVPLFLAWIAVGAFFGRKQLREARL